ncbi:STM2901 family protein [Rahnella rivi]|uniref:STM2901 family protein n=1 Tax=Rahnella rivi TaxID=2816249 RepID=UPI0039BEAA8D
MDTTEQVSGYYFSGLSNLSAGELFFWVFLDETGKQIGIADFANLALIILGQPMKATRAKPLGATPGTSTLSYHLRQWLNIEVKHWPTLTNGSIRKLKFSYVTNLGAFTGRWIPILGWVILADDVATIAYKSTNRYNTIANEKDRLW